MDGVCRAIRDETATLRSGPVFTPGCTSSAFKTPHKLNNSAPGNKHKAKCSLPKSRTELNKGGNAGPRSKALHARDGVCRAIRDETATLRSGPVFTPGCTDSAINRRKKTCFFKQVSSNMVGERGFEPPTHWSQTSCATKLRYSPMGANITAPPWERQSLFRKIRPIAWKANSAAKSPAAQHLPENPYNALAGVVAGA
jgi:hypothetical protein